MNKLQENQVLLGENMKVLGEGLRENLEEGLNHMLNIEEC